MSSTSAPAPYNVVSHPVLLHKLTLLRTASTPPADFRRLVKEISSILGVEASRNLDLRPIPNARPRLQSQDAADLPIAQLQSPIASFTGHEIAHRIGISPILRAGIGMTDPILDLFPTASVFYLGLFREKVSLQPVEYYQKLPAHPTVDTLFLLDPLVATGGTAIAAVSMLLDWGLQISNIKLLVLLGSKPGLDAVASACPGLEIFVGGVDDQLTEEGMILPGLGDSGDRLFSTLG